MRHPPSSFIVRCLVFCAAIVAAACGPMGRPLTSADIAKYGTASYAASVPQVFRAVQGALKSEGYEIAVADARKGFIKTNRKVIRSDTQAVATGNAYYARGYATSVDISRQYVINITDQGGRALVVAEPRVYAGERDLSQESVWDIDSPAGERRLWERLFHDVQEAL